MTWGKLRLDFSQARRWLALAAALFPAGVGGVTDLTFGVEDVGGKDWRASGIVVSLDLGNDRAIATIERLELRSLSQELRDVRIDCPRLDLRGSQVACERAQITANWPTGGAQALRASVVYDRGDGSLDLRAENVRMPVAPLLKLAGDPKSPVSALSGEGFVTLSLRMHVAEQGPSELVVNASFTDLTINNESGSIASDKLHAQLQATARKRASVWEFTAELQSSRGQAYFQPIFLDLGAHDLSLRSSGKWSGNALTLDRFALAHTAVVDASGTALVDFDQEQPLRSANVEVKSLEFPGAYLSYFQPLLLDTSFKSMTTGGSLAGRITIEGGAPESIDLVFNDITADDGAGSFALARLQGDWHWSSQGAGAPSSLRWNNGALLGLQIGAGELQFTSNGRQFVLLQPTRIPLLDGAIAVESLRMRNAGTPQVAFIIDATIEPISVQRLCKAFGWPEFGGSVGGTISKLRMREGILSLGTTLRAQVFDGEVTFSDLRLEQPFGNWPRFYSNIALDKLDLELLTSAFSFGRITGRLSGAVEGLQLFNWAPVAFDARLHTSPGDRSKHRISQRAVESIGSIGGGGAGITAALSSGFLRFFDDFNYDRLGWSCRLENEVCVMDGVAPAPNGGYYLVKGSGLPRIDVIGSARRVDWPRLVQQLIAVTESEGPTIGK
jgi:hypothetical protein